ncbi:MAG: hypothetical protein AMS24_00635 [Chlamydiae bacterium SM23_39]|nr:MAG: hypothetical protein AMS24_00635 [Chlamydiae bacterium SM23_39]
MLAGLPPIAGLFSAIFGCIFVGFFGSSKYLIPGPTTAMAILIQTSISDVIYNYFPTIQGAERDVLYLNILLHIVLIIGIVQIIFGFFNMGKVLHFVSRSVILGYFAGVIIAIFVNQLYPLFGISDSLNSNPTILKFFDVILRIKEINIYSLMLGALATGFLIFFNRKFPKIPNSFLMIIIISLIVYFFNRYLLKEDFHIFSIKDIKIFTLEKIRFHLPSLNFKIVKLIFPSALAISLLGILEIFSASKSIEEESKNDINYNQEVFSFGLSNLFLSMISFAMPASGSISRTLFNYRLGAKSRISAILSGIFVAICIFFGWVFIKHIPLIALSAILIALLPTFLDYRQIKFCFTVTKGDALVFLLTLFSCLVFSLSVAFFIGITLSIIFYLRRAAVPHVVEYFFNKSGRLVLLSEKKRVYSKIRIIGIAGELFFASVDLFQKATQKVLKDSYVKVIILRLNNVYYMDASMCYAILKLYEHLKSSNRYFLISGVTPEIGKIFLRSGFLKKIGKENIFFTDETRPQLSTWRACLRAGELTV